MQEGRVKVPTQPQLLISAEDLGSLGWAAPSLALQSALSMPTSLQALNPLHHKDFFHDDLPASEICAASVEGVAGGQSKDAADQPCVGLAGLNVVESTSPFILAG